jgi:segregation and condensation protein A
VIEKKIPWWRKALHVALDAIRSGFGLFPHSAKVEEENALTDFSQKPEIAAVEPPSPAEAVAEPAPLPVAVPEAVSEPAQQPTPNEAVTAPEPTPAEPEPTPTSNETAVAPEPKPTPDEAATEPTVEELAVLKGHDFSRAANAAKSTRPLGPEGCSSAVEPEPESAAEEAQATEKEELDEASEPDQADEPDAVVEPTAAETSKAESEPEAAQTPEERTESVLEIAPEIVNAPVPEPKESVETAVEIEPASEAVNEPVPEQTEEPAAVPEAEPEAVAEPVSPAVVPEPSTAAEPESASEPEPASAPNAVAPLVLTPEPTAAEEATQKADERAAAKQAAQQKKRDESSAQSPFSVVVGQVYDGPLDLLLDLIRKQDIDIYDIPIAKITSQFLAYVNQLKASDMDVAGEFIYTASLLIHIKSKMLLPREAKGPDDAGEDPRQELVEKLLEHERFKEAAQMLQQKQMLEAATWSNPGISEFKDDVAAEPEIAADTVDLVRVFRDILERARKRPAFNVQEDSVTVGQMIQFLSRRLTMEDKPVALHRLLSHSRSERALVAMFLALLELVRLQAILLRQDRAFSEIFIKKHSNFDAVMDEGLANARDDWR